MNNVMNEMLKKQYKRLIKGQIKTINGVEYLVSKGFDTIRFSAFKEWMKDHGCEI